MRLRIRTRCWMLLSVLALVGCANHPPQAQSSAQHAECLVCKRNADLACVDVLVDSSTPRYDYNGRTYYFCSEECKSKFVKEPGKYVEK